MTSNAEYPHCGPRLTGTYLAAGLPRPAVEAVNKPWPWEFCDEKTRDCVVDLADEVPEHLVRVEFGPRGQEERRCGLDSRCALVTGGLRVSPQPNPPCAPWVMNLMMALLPAVLVLPASLDPGSVNGNHPVQVILADQVQSAEVIVRMATIGPDGPTGTFQVDSGEQPW